VPAVLSAESLPLFFFSWKRFCLMFFGRLEDDEMTELRATGTEIMSALITESIGHNLWSIQRVLVWLSKDGKMWVTPCLFRTDKFTKPGPNSIGQRDRAAVFHDFMVRCRVLLGLTMMQCHNYFLEAMVYCDQFDLPEKLWKRTAASTWRRLTRNVYYAAVVTCNWTFANEGDGLYGDMRFDVPVADGVPLDVWVREHYDPNGAGYMNGDGGSFFHFRDKTWNRG